MLRFSSSREMLIMWLLLDVFGDRVIFVVVRK